MKHMNYVGAPLVVLAGLAAATAMAGSARASETVLFNCFFPPQYVICSEILPELATEVEEATEGRVRFVIPPKSLSGPSAQLEGVVNGVMDAAISYNAFTANESTGMQLTQLPFIGRELSSASSVALWRTYQKFFAGKPGEFESVELLSVHNSPGASLFSLTDTPISSVEGLSRLKIWAPPGDTANVIKGTGSAVVSGPAIQMLELVSSGVVDGYVGVAWDVLDSLKLGSYTKVVTETNAKILEPSFSTFINKDKWAKISDEDQQTIRGLMGERLGHTIGIELDALAQAARDKYTAEGVKVTEASAEFEAALVELGKPAVDDWKEKVAAMGVDGDEAIAYFHATYNELLPD